MAERTGLPIDTIASRKRYGLAKLRKDLQDYA
jgi:DNA-directed RNA polymerase specialized sigma24 family protein